MVLRTLTLVFFIQVLFIRGQVDGNEVLGCGGFIKSHTDIDFSKVEIKLFTKHGSLKDKTDCSPSNGYYFLPIYDKGDYLLRISPPPGWSFEPEQVELTFDGKTDACSQGRDVNFSFKGFGITGRATFVGKTMSGARGVNVELKSADGKEVRNTVTDLNGIFSFTPIIPGKYTIKATYPKWHFAKAEHTVNVVSGNTELPENSLVVSGFDVSGRFDTSGQLTTGVGAALFRRVGDTLPLMCNKHTAVPLSIDNKNYERSSACYAQVENSGEYSFTGVAPGKYLVLPIVENPDLMVHISPSFLEFEVTRDSAELKDSFKITGFSVTGKVLTALGGTPLAGAVVKLNGVKVTETDKSGNYVLKNIKSDTYKLQVEAHQYTFKEQEVKVRLSNPKIPSIIPSTYEVCGKVISENSYVVGFTKEGSTFHTTVDSKPGTGEWCKYLPIGKYIVEVMTNDDKAGGAQFFPLQHTIEVQQKPLKGITFSQLRATIKGEINCLPDSPTSCTAAEVTLHSLDAAGQITGEQKVALAINGKYVFKDVLSGPYEITIPQSNLCFESTRAFMNVVSANESASPFVHRGYEVTIISSHRVIMKYTHISTNAAETSSAEILKLLAGVNTFCVSKFGSYNIKLEGCHLYDDSLPKTISTTDLNPILITAIAHRVGVRVMSTEPNADSLQLEVESSSLGKMTITPIAEAHKVDGKFAYRYDVHLKPDEILNITPKSEVLLFTPASKQIVGSNDCVDIAFNFIAARGLIIRGRVVPAIKDAKITLTFPNNGELANQHVHTSVTGEFKFGPIDESLYFQLSAEKESYVFSEYNRQSASFSAHKLCEIIVKVKDETGKLLNGVLLSLSGAESYRKNLMTSDNGTISFHSLSPSQYFLRPMMKEYKFEPNSKVINILDGATENVELVAKRVAYSVFGTISSLSGDPFPQVNIEAIAEESCMHHQEEASSENNGQYRLRGLQPGCSYTIALKDSGKSNTNVERSIPKQRTIKIENQDVRGVNLVAISPATFTDVAVRVKTSLNDHYKTLRLLMYRKGAPDSPIYSQRVETPVNPKARYNPGILVLLPRIQMDGKMYIVELKSTISDKTYTFVTPMAQFVADQSSVFIELEFYPEVRTTEADINQNSISALILVALVAIAFFRQDIAMSFLDFVMSKFNRIAQDIASKQKTNKKDTRKSEQISQKEIEHMADQINAIKKKKTKKI